MIQIIHVQSTRIFDPAVFSPIEKRMIDHALKQEGLNPESNEFNHFIFMDNPINKQLKNNPVFKTAIEHLKTLIPHPGLHMYIKPSHVLNLLHHQKFPYFEDLFSGKSIQALDMQLFQVIAEIVLYANIYHQIEQTDQNLPFPEINNEKNLIEDLIKDPDNQFITNPLTLQELYSQEDHNMETPIIDYCEVYKTPLFHVMKDMRWYNQNFHHYEDDDISIYKEDFIVACNMQYFIVRAEIE